jgi:cobalt-zinc-cadmium efflux system outer membrane protein
LFDQGRAAVFAAGSLARQKEHLVRDLAVRIRASTRALYAASEAGRQRARFIKQSVLPLKQSVTAETQKEYNAMLVGAFDLLRAKREEIESGAGYIDALYDYWTSRNDIEQLLSGRFVEAGLKNSESSTRTRRTSEAH